MLAERLKNLRKEAGLTQKQIAEKLQVGQNSYSNWEKGKRTPIQPTIEKLAEILNTSTDYLLGKTDIPDRDLEIDIDNAIDNSVAYDGTPITDNDREIIKNFLKDYFSNKK
ncbi:helix-turn-helix domain-containing protein [Streptococcus oralis]|uniref:DNA-binding helix-turn-helix protein n=1 Tax=Streptococcus oralis SK610 TaxID=1095741 RepID=I0Q0Y1_STROR|nr:helix-turn-helix transcriptional regulator [Streptococcus oralis]EIC74933.1 DNA-binding helix-turn-helix protein [Streptococcus oralis SK610]